MEKVKVILPTEDEVADAVDQARCRMSEISLNLKEGKYEYSHLRDDGVTKMGSFDNEDLAEQHLLREIVPLAIQILGGDLDKAIVWNKGRKNLLEHPSSVDDEVIEYFNSNT